jgi:hypothetical protein
MRGKEVFESVEKTAKLSKFVKWTCAKLKIVECPQINYSDDIDEVKSRRSFGSANSNGEIWVHVGDRNAADVMRTLCHELIHKKQFEESLAYDDMDEETRQNIEDVANAMAGRLMREYGKQNVDIYL